jgi:two-component system OmpR family response regulator
LLNIELPSFYLPVIAMVASNSVNFLSKPIGISIKATSLTKPSYDRKMQTARILIVDDEPAVREMVADAITLAGHFAAIASDGFEAVQKLKSEHFNLLISDINMPKIDGYELVERLRAKGDQIPVIFLTARSEKPDVARGLRIGADDYIAKPFGLEELTLRVAAILRRTMPLEASSSLLICGPVKLDFETHRVTVFDKEVELSPTEFRLLSYLMENKNKVLTKHALLDEIWGLGFTDTASVVDTFISYLRKKIHTEGFDGIKTVRGIGFQIVDKS